MNIEQANAIPMETVIKLIGEKAGNRIKGDTIIEVVCNYLRATGEDHTTVDALRWLTNMTQSKTYNRALNSMVDEVSEWRLIRIEPLDDLALIRYLASLKIPLSLAKTYLVEVSVKHKGITQGMSAIGFKNEEGGYELCNPFIRSYVGKRSISFIRSKQLNSGSVHLFKDLLDLLTAFRRFPDLPDTSDVICLNAYSCLSEVFPLIDGYGYRQLISWMDKDGEGLQAEQRIRQFVIRQPGLKLKLGDIAAIRYGTK